MARTEATGLCAVPFWRWFTSHLLLHQLQPFTGTASWKGPRDTPQLGHISFLSHMSNPDHLLLTGISWI